MSRWLPLLLAGCIVGPGDPDQPPPADYERFVAEVQPVLGARCANPACHGNDERPLALYAVQRHRADPDDTFRSVPLTEDELWANYVRCVGFITETPETGACMLLAKPLAPEAGGAQHAGGDQFLDRTEPDYQRIAGWVQAALDAPGDPR